ncbi:MAG: hypothetical protein LBC55_06080 [Desulfovibrio sp.]|nr:hypothetical protein [Desulfovibrio sp.]
MRIFRKLLLRVDTVIIIMITEYCTIYYYVLTDYNNETAQAALFTASKATQRYLDKSMRMRYAVAEALDNHAAPWAVDKDSGTKHSIAPRGKNDEHQDQNYFRIYRHDNHPDRCLDHQLQRSEQSVSIVS